ncbi:MAG: hypothetical protein ACYS26_03360 [Planctomycetota bacterium]
MLFLLLVIPLSFFFLSVLGESEDATGGSVGEAWRPDEAARDPAATPGLEPETPEQRSESPLKRKPWIPMPEDIAIEGRSMREVLSDWHGDRWDLLLARHGEMAFLDRECDVDSLGDPYSCLDTEVLRIVLGSFDSNDRSMLAKKYSTVVRFGDGLAGAEDVLKGAVESLDLNVGLAEVLSTGSAWDNAVWSVEDDLDAFMTAARFCVEEARESIVRDLSGLSAVQPPKQGLLLFAPFWSPPHPDYDHGASIYGRNLFYSGGDPASTCGSFVFSYSIDLHGDPLMLDALQVLSDRRAALRLKLRNVVNALPK